MIAASSSSMAYAMKFFLIIAITSVFSYIPTGRTLTQTLLFSSKPQSYAELLQASKLAKQNGGLPVSRMPTPSAQPPKSVPVPVETAIRSSPDVLPFDGVIYDHLKYVIGKLSARMKSGTSLSSEELKTFQNSCLEIIRDAKATTSGDVVAKVENDDEVFSTPFPKDMGLAVADRRNGKDVVHKAVPMKRSEPKQQAFVIYEAGEGPATEDKPDPNSPFSDLHGLSNTWQMPGMDNMSTEEYYAAINKRIVDMKSKRKFTEGSSNTMVNDYFESLSRKKDE